MATKLDQLAYEAKRGRRPYWLGLLIAIDQLANALLWGYNDETLSSRAYRNAAKPAAKRRWVLAEGFINQLFAWDKAVIAGRTVRHCELAYLGELAREHLPSDFQV